MIASLIDIGKNRAIKIPSSVLPVMKNLKVVNLSLDFDRVIIRPTNKNPRAGWDKFFKENDGKLLIDDGLDIDNWHAL
ncbi:MAG: hypothetical protein DRQ51_08790 [Gammaproteobacteria bacterium]|nr:MAG: hypothetical protein DRQ51_08790 [Gammaproteobacteria bacterium]